MQNKTTLCTHEQDLSDHELIIKYKNGDELALVTLVSRYKSVVEMISRSFYLTRTDRDDILQEGMIALLKAINKYKQFQNQSNLFYPFAKKVIYLHMIGILRKHTRRNHQILNLAIPLENHLYDNENDYAGIIDYYPCAYADNPVDVIIEKENVDEIHKFIQFNFSVLESRVIYLYLEDQSYKNISDILGVSIKTVDNALTRIKRKLKKGVLDKGICNIDQINN